ncbi:Dystrotelin [Sciurus carolinensis]|uniref:Dystrotelin n=1 Tax=Sciurus carolinensis TaxID=30640 RepID=A0AA41NGL7_SCICA|nr:Dystrotelin [Sciurus carolinensis]
MKSFVIIRKEGSVLHLIPTVDLIDSSLIEQVFLHGSFWEARESSLSVHQLLQALQELFQRTKEGKSGQVNPRASELILSLLQTMYDSTGTGFLKILPVAAALIALSGDSPLTKYRALFQLYAENNKGNYDSGARMTRKTLRNLLKDLQQIPTIVGESHTLCPVESAVRSCFKGVLSQGIKEEKFLSWIQSEPLILLWLPICHRLSATEMVTHPVRCSVCRTFPIVGLSCKVPAYVRPTGQPEAASRRVRQRVSQPQGADVDSPHHQTLVSIKNELWRIRESINALHRERRVLKQQFSQYKEKLQALHTSQQEKSSRFETKIHELTTQQESLWTRLQQMEQDLQAMSQPLLPVSSLQNMMSRVDHFSAGKSPKEDISQIKNVTENGPEWEPLPNPAIVDASQANAENALPRSESPETLLQSTRLQSYAQKIPKEILSSLPSRQEGLLQETPQIPPPEISRPALAPAERKEIINIKERNDQLEEEEIQELLSKLMDAFNLEKPSGKVFPINRESNGQRLKDLII